MRASCTRLFSSPPLLTFFLAATLTSASAQQALSPQAAATSPTALAQVHDADADAPRTEFQGDLFRDRGRYVAAIRAYEGAEPKTASLYNKLGIAYEHMRMNDPAREAFRKALQLNPSLPEVYNNLGTLAHSQGDRKKAEKFYQRSIKLNPASADAQKNLGTLYYAWGKYRKGEEAYRRARELDSTILARTSRASIDAPSDPKSIATLHYHLARTYALAGSDQIAIEYLRRAISEGFKDRRLLLTDQEFAGLWNEPAFRSLVDDLKLN